MNRSYFAVAARGIEQVTARELERLGAQGVRPVAGGVHFEGDMLLLYRASLWLRTASRILRPLREFAASTPEMLYSQARRVRWEDFLDPSKTLAVQATLEGAGKRSERNERQAETKRGGDRGRGRFEKRKTAPSGINNSMYAGLKVKDAIVDRLRREQGARPNVDKEYPDFVIHAHFSAGRCTLSLDATGTSLHERGYRARGAEAPLKETLAAAIVELTGWDGASPLFDPMCGSGTIVIEGALKAMRIAPGLARRTFGFQRWPEFDGKAWQKVVAEAQEQKLPASSGKIFASDSDPQVIETARENARRAGVLDAIAFDVKRVAEIAPPSNGAGVIVTNPPYGERLGEESALETLYEQIGKVLQSRFVGWQAFIFAGNLPLARRIGLEATEKHRLNNGPLECRLLKFVL